MSFFQALTGNSTAIDVRKHDADFENHLIEGEELQTGFKMMRDYVAFTNKRIVVVDKQGMTGSKRSYASYPYSRIVNFEVETKGTMDRDAEVRVFLQGAAGAIALQFKDNDTARDVGKMIARIVLAK